MMVSGITYPAPAKINEFLHVIERLPSGYHRLQTVFRLIDFCDYLTFYPREDGKIRLITKTTGITEDNDLASRAARLLQVFSKVSQGVDIAIEKHIPLGSGLGGGSSNAATTLMALNRLWKIDLSQQTLLTLGLELGADVPFFIFGQDAFADGVGEELSPVTLPDCFYLLLFPPVSISTAAIFTHPDLLRSSPPICCDDYRFGTGQNMLLPLVRRLYPVVGQYIDWLNQFSPATMSGSGSTVFARFSTLAEAEAAFECLPDGYQGRITSNLKKHPLS